MVGASANEVRPSYFVMKYLIDKGYEVDAGQSGPGRQGNSRAGKSSRALEDIPLSVDMIDVFRNSEAAGAITSEALALDPLPKVIWMQLGCAMTRRRALAEAKGVQVVMNRCPKMEYGKLSGEWAWVGGNSGLISSRRPTLHIQAGSKVWDCAEALSAAPGASTAPKRWRGRSRIESRHRFVAASAPGSPQRHCSPTPLARSGRIVSSSRIELSQISAL